MCLATAVELSLHHIHKHPRDDLRANLVMLCGDGTTGCHGKIEAHDSVTSLQLGRYLLEVRRDAIEYLAQKTGGPEARSEWMLRQFGVYRLD